MIPFLIAGVGLLIGGTVVAMANEEEKKTLRECSTKLEESNAELNEKLRQATNREVKFRLENLSLTLNWVKSRLDNLLNDNNAAISQLERLYSLTLALEKIIDNIPSDGVLQPSDKRLVDIITKFQSKTPLTAEDRGYIEDYLDRNIGDKRRDFLEDRLASTYKNTSSKLRNLRREKTAKELDLLTLQHRRRIEVVSFDEESLITSRINKLIDQINEAQRSLDDIELSLVVLTRVSRPELAQGADDLAALDCVQYLARGESLTDEEAAFMSSYRDRYFSTAREILKQKRQIDLALQQEAA